MSYLEKMFMIFLSHYLEDSENSFNFAVADASHSSPLGVK